MERRGDTEDNTILIMPMSGLNIGYMYLEDLQLLPHGTGTGIGIGSGSGLEVELEATIGTDLISEVGIEMGRHYWEWVQWEWVSKNYRTGDRSHSCGMADIRSRQTLLNATIAPTL